MTAKQGVFDFNKKTVARDGVVDPKKHKTFMDTFGHKLEKFFLESDIAELRRVGGLKEHVDSVVKTREQSFKALQKSFSGELESLRPGALVKRLWGKEPDPSEIRQLKELLKNDPAVLEAFQAEAVRDMGQRITLREGQSRALNFKKLDSYLFGTGVDGTSGKAAALKELFGEEYMVGLNTLRTALKTAQRKAVAPDRSNTSTASAALNDVARAYLGLFTRSGRILTAALRGGYSRPTRLFGAGR